MITWSVCFANDNMELQAILTFFDMLYWSLHEQVLLCGHDLGLFKCGSCVG